jgi:hypothetical protein
MLNGAGTRSSTLTGGSRGSQSLTCGAKNALVCAICSKMIVLPRQARDKHGGNSTKEIVFRRALFDLKRDPHELRNIYNETKAMNPGLVAALDGQLRELYSCSGAGCN